MNVRLGFRLKGILGMLAPNAGIVVVRKMDPQTFESVRAAIATLRVFLGDKAEFVCEERQSA